MFGKTSKQGGGIGLGANTAALTPGDITFNSGEYTLIGNARGALIGGGAGSNGAAAGGDVYINGGTFNLNIDFSGAAIGGGGFAFGNDKPGGNLYYTGGSIRTFIDYNAVDPNGNGIGEGLNGDSLWPVDNYGVNDAVITANKVNGDGTRPVYLVAFDTSLAQEAVAPYTIMVDDDTIYTGGKHGYKFVNEDLFKNDQISIGSTPTNWAPLTTENNFYFYLTGENHELSVNDETFSVIWNADNSTFSIEAANTGSNDPTIWDGVTYDTSWYNETDTEFTLESAAQLAGLAKIVNNKPESSEAGAVTGIDSNVPADDFLGKTVTLTIDVDLGGVEESPGVLDLTALTWTSPVWSGNTWVPIASFTSSGAHTAGGSGDGAYGRPFKGVFDGGFHTISNIYVPGDPTQGYDSPLTNGHAVFGDLGRDGLVKNLIIDSGYIRGARYVGGIVGRNWGHVENTGNYATIETDGDRSGGGIVGVNYTSLAAAGWTPWVKNSYNFGTIMKGDQRYSGGIACDNEGLIENCYNAGTGAFRNSATGAVGALMGGIVGGYRSVGTITNCWSLSGDGQPTRIVAASANTPAGSGFKTDAEMKSEDFVATLGAAFQYNEGGYPLLVGQSIPESPEPEPAIDTRWYNTTDTTFEIDTAAELAGLAAIVNGTVEDIEQDSFAGKTVTQVANIVLEEDGLFSSATGRFGSSGYPMEAIYYTVQEGAKLWTPIGVGTATGSNAFSETNFFAGTYDGADLSISGLYTDGSLTVQGLFGCVSGTVKNVKVTSGLVAAKIVAGGIAAYLNGGTIENCSNGAIIYADGGQVAGSGQENGVSRGGAIGGIVGNAVGSDATPFTITGCANTGDVVCTNTNKGGRAGGILGLIDSAAYTGVITNSSNGGNVNAYQYSGGIVGFNYSKVAPISGCVNQGNIQVNSSGSAYGGGIVSQCYSNISNCYNTGIYTGALLGGDKTAHLGGIVSDLYAPATVSNCYNTGRLALGGTAATSSSTGRIVGSGGGAHSTEKANVFDCYYLSIDSELQEFADAEQGWLAANAEKTADEMRTSAFALALGEAFNLDSDTINNGYPVLDWQGGTEPVRLPYDISWYNTTDTSFEIGTADELKGFAAIVNGTVEGIEQDSFAGKTLTLTADITLEDVWTPVGTAIPSLITYGGQVEISSVADESIPFSGTFDGAGHMISGISVSGATGSEGFFAYVSAEGTIKDLTIVGAISDTVAPPGGEHPAGTDYVGGLVAYNRGHLAGITNLVVINAPAVYNVAGIAGFNDGRDNPNAVIENCANLANITGQQKVGGIVGQNAGVVRDSYNAAKVDGTNASSKNGVGGIAGRNGNNNTAVETGVIINCYNTGEVGRSGQKWVGGITGFQNSLSSITNSYMVGTVVSGAGNNNPIVGLNESSRNANNYSLVGITATGTSVGEKGVVRSADEMKDIAFAKLLGEAYNFDSAVINNGYPVLDWQGGTPPPVVGAPGSGDLDGDGSVTSAEMVTLARFIVSGLGDFTSDQFAAIDMDGDNALTMADIILMMRKAAGL
jgi:hypothetical protein